MNFPANALAGVSIALLLSTSGIAAGYPTKPVTLVAPQAVGGAADLAARAFAVVAEKYLGQPVRVVNKAGGGGVPGVMSVKTARADGYTMLATLSPFVLTGPVFRKNNPYKTMDFDYMAILEDQPLTLAVSKASRFSDARAFLDAARSSQAPIKIAVASRIGLATISYHALVKDLGLTAGELSPIPYKSGPAAARGLLAGDVDVASINLASINAALRSGDARLLMVTTPERNHSYPAVPTARELNLPTVDGITLWVGLLGPKGLPSEVVDTWQAVLPKIFADRDYRDLLARRGATLVGKLAPETLVTVNAQLASYEKLKTLLK